MDLETVISSVMVIGAYSALVTVAKNSRTQLHASFTTKSGQFFHPLKYNCNTEVVLNK